jgi:hypothetical protein
MNRDKPQTRWYTSLVNVLLEGKYEVLFKFFQMPSSSRISPCNTDTLHLGTVTINHSYVLMYSIVKLHCNMFRLKLKCRHQAKNRHQRKITMYTTLQQYHYICSRSRFRSSVNVE